MSILESLFDKNHSGDGLQMRYLSHTDWVFSSGCLQSYFEKDSAELLSRWIGDAHSERKMGNVAV